MLAGADDLSDWAAARGPGFFLPADNAVLTALARVSQWATTQQYEPVAVNTFFQVGLDVHSPSIVPFSNFDH